MHYIKNIPSRKRVRNKNEEMYPSELIRKEALRQDLSPRTIRTYLVCVEQFFRKYQKNPFFINKKDIQEYLDHLLERGAPGNTINVHLNTLKFFYEQVLHKKLTVNIKYSKTAKSSTKRQRKVIS